MTFLRAVAILAGRSANERSGSVAQPEIAVKLPSRPAGVPEQQWITLPDAEGVIFAAEQGWMWHGANLGPTWTASREVVLAAEARVATFLRSYPPHEPGAAEADWLQRRAAPLITARLRSYQRQYAGIFFEGRRALFMNFFPRGSCEHWTTHPVAVKDGGHDYFQLIYRPEAEDFPWFRANGEA